MAVFLLPMPLLLSDRRYLVVVLCVIAGAVLLLNVYYLYTTPIANTWVWWIGDETWLMAQYDHFVRTGHYTNPLAPGSGFSQCSGLLFGSCYVTAALYGLPKLLIVGHTIAVGRTLTMFFALATLITLWIVARRYSVGPILRIFGCVLLASTVCFFITSHSARSDMVVALSILLMTGCLPLLLEKQSIGRLALLGLMFPLGLLISAHVLILVFPALIYLIVSAGGLKSGKAIAAWMMTCIGGAVALLMLQYVLLGSVSLFGPFSGSSVLMPILHIHHPKTDLANMTGRLAIARTWAPGILGVSFVLATALAWAKLKFNVGFTAMSRVERRMILATAILVVSSILLEFYEARYLIYVLPAVVLSFLVLSSHLLQRLPRSSSTVLSAVVFVCLVLGLLHYGVEVLKMGATGDTITAANKSAVTNALAAIHAHHAGRVRVFCTVPAQAVAMDDDSCELITPVIFVEPTGQSMSRNELWTRANINYAIVCVSPHRSIDWDDVNTYTYPADRSREHLIFEQAGPFSDIGRVTYDPSDLRALDTLRVYEYR